VDLLPPRPAGTTSFHPGAPGRAKAFSRALFRLAGPPNRTSRVVGPRVSRGPAPGPGPDSEKTARAAGVLAGIGHYGPAFSSRRLPRRWCGLLGGMPEAPRSWAWCAHRRTPGHSRDAKRVARASYVGAGLEPGRVWLPGRGSLRVRLPPGPRFSRGPAGSTPSADSCRGWIKVRPRAAP
jgi:hypothetical protein